jgi:hypothetical protein
VAAVHDPSPIFSATTAVADTKLIESDVFSEVTMLVPPLLPPQPQHAIVAARRKTADNFCGIDTFGREEHTPRYLCSQTNLLAIPPKPPSGSVPNESSRRVFLLTTNFPLRSRE